MSDGKYPFPSAHDASEAMSKATRDVRLEELPDSKDSAPETKDDEKTHKPPTLDFMPLGMTTHLQAAPSTFGKIKESENNDMGNKTAHIEV